MAEKQKQSMFRNGSTLFLRVALVAMASLIAFLCVVLSSAFTDPGNTEFKLMVSGLYVAAVPFFYALYQAWILLDLIQANKAFTSAAVHALGTVSKCAAIIAGLFVLYWPMFFELADRDDAPGVFGISLIITFMSLVISVFTGVLKKLFQNGVDIKRENDLTV